MSKASNESSSASDLEHMVTGFQPDREMQNDDQSLEQYERSSDNADLERTPSMFQRIQTRLSFFNERLKKQRFGLVMEFGFIYLIMGFFVLGIFSIYWGSMYKRETRLPNLKFLVVIDNDTPVNNIPTFGEQLQLILNSTKAKSIGGWEIQNITHFKQEADKRNNTVEQEINRQIHHQLYWLSIYVKENATYDFYQALANNDASYNVSDTFRLIYETGRDFLTMTQYVTPQVKIIENMWLDAQSNAVRPLAENLNDTERSALFNSNGNINLLTTPLSFEYIDRVPYSDPVLVAPSQVGLIYMIILTFFNVNFFADVHKRVATFNLKKPHYLLYRLIASIISYFWLSLMYSLVTLAFQVNFNATFGKSGFLIYWMVSWLTMWCVGGVNETVAQILILIYPPLLGFWLLFWVIVNISPTFTMLALSPKIFRYGYGLPLHNSYEVTKVIFFDIYKGNLGRNLGILSAWGVLNVFTLMASTILFGVVMGKRAQKAAQAASKEAK